MFSPPEKIVELIEEFRKAEDLIEDEIVMLVWLSRGGITWEEGWTLGSKQREKILKKYTELTRKMAGDTTEYM